MTPLARPLGPRGCRPPSAIPPARNTGRCPPRQGMGQEIQCRDGSDQVAAGWRLSDQTVAPLRQRGLPARSTDHHERRRPRIAQMPRRAALFAERQHGDVHAGINTYLDMTSMYERAATGLPRRRGPGPPRAPGRSSCAAGGRDQTERSEATASATAAASAAPASPPPMPPDPPETSSRTGPLDVHCLTPLSFAGA